MIVCGSLRNFVWNFRRVPSLRKGWCHLLRLNHELGCHVLSLSHELWYHVLVGESRAWNVGRTVDRGVVR